jgi:hypothetical protein
VTVGRRAAGSRVSSADAADEPTPAKPTESVTSPANIAQIPAPLALIISRNTPATASSRDTAIPKASSAGFAADEGAARMAVGEVNDARSCLPQSGQKFGGDRKGFEHLEHA